MEPRTTTYRLRSLGRVERDDPGITDAEAINTSIAGVFIAILISGLTMAEAGQTLTDFFGQPGTDFAEAIGASRVPEASTTEPDWITESGSSDPPSEASTTEPDWITEPGSPDPTTQ